MPRDRLSGSSALTLNAQPSKRDRTTEDRVVGAVWDELGRLLVEQFRVPSERPRYLDALIVESADRMTYEGYGSQYPVASNVSEEGRALNRRVEVIVGRGVVMDAKSFAKTQGNPAN